MRRRHVLVGGFALGALVAFAVVAAAGWSGLLRQTTGFTVSGLLPASPTPSPQAAPASADKAAVRKGAPVQRAGPVMAYDPENGGVIMFGGSAFVPTADGSNSVSLGDTWLWNGTSWSQLNVQGALPAKRIGRRI